MFNRTPKNKHKPIQRMGTPAKISEFAMESAELKPVGIRFDYRTALFFAALAIYLLLTTFFKINGSSVGMWNAQFAKQAQTDPRIIFGSPHAIRQDEWAVNTPAILSQFNSKTPFPADNYSLGGFKTPLVMDVPTAHFSTLLRPQYWLFFLTDIETAYAFYWNIRLVILVGGFFLLLMFLLENNFALSLFGAFWVYFSAYIQWWYSSPQMWPLLVGYFALYTTSFLLVLTSRKKPIIIASSLVFIASFFNFAISLYPPHQVPLVYLSFCIVLAVLLPRFRPVVAELSTNRFKLVCFGASLLLTAALLLVWYWDVQQTLAALAATVYPGQRRMAGGGMSVAQIFNGFLGPFMTEGKFPHIWGNVCESSNFLLFFPIPLILMFRECFLKKKISVYDALFTAYITIIILWQLLGFPEPIARFTLFDRVVEKRALLSLGIASVLWTCISLHRIMKGKSDLSRGFRISVTAIMLICILLYCLYSLLSRLAENQIVTDDSRRVTALDSASAG